MATDIKLGRAFTEKLVAEHMERKDIIVETSMAKFWTTEMANRIADRSIDLCGDYGTLEKCVMVRAWRDIRVTRIFAGTNEVMRGIAAKFMGL
jgi:acyl-CoA dehydrogenase